MADGAMVRSTAAKGARVCWYFKKFPPSIVLSDKLVSTHFSSSDVGASVMNDQWFFTS